MFYKALIAVSCIVCSPLFAASEHDLQQEIKRLRQQNHSIQKQLNQLEHKVDRHTSQKASTMHTQPQHSAEKDFHSSMLSVHAPESHPESIGFYPTALIADDKVVTFIAGTPIVTSPYTGERPAFDGSDYIVNISSINRDIRLMQQRRRLYNAYRSIGYPIPNRPIISLSGKAVPVADYSRPFNSNSFGGDLNLGASEVDVAAMLNNSVEAFIGIAYDNSPPNIGGQRISNSAFNLNLGFVNIGDLERSPFYFTAGQLFVPFGKYASSMISAPITMVLARTKTRPIILGYKTQHGSGPYLAAYTFRSDTILGSRAVGGINGGYVYEGNDVTGDFAVSYIGALNDAGGMQRNGSVPGTTFGGFASITNGSEAVAKRPALDVHANVSFDRYTVAAEWVGASKAFRPQDLSFNGQGAKPSAGQLEAGVTFHAFDKPASFSVGYQWSKNALALNLPRQRVSGVFNISIWKDTVESLEYRHDIDYNINQFGNGATAPGLTNLNTVGTGRTSDTVLAQIGVFF